MKKIKILCYNIFAIILIICISSSASAAYARYYPEYDEIAVFEATDNVNLSWISSQINNSSQLNNNGTVWYLNATLRLYSTSKANICPPICTKLIMNNEGSLHYTGDLDIHNVEIIGGKEIGTWRTFHDLYIHDAGGIRLDGISEDVYNITIINSVSGLKLRNSNNIKIYNVSVSNTTQTAIDCYNCDNTEIYDINVNDAGDYTNPGTGCYAILYQAGSEFSSAHDILVDGTGWSSIEATDMDTNNITFYNITVYNSGHNGLDLHGGYDHTVNNMTVYRSVSNNYLICFAYNCKLTNISSYDVGLGRGILASEMSNFTLENYYSEDAGQALASFQLNGLQVINMTSVNSDYGLYYTYLNGENVINATIIDSKFIHSAQKDIWIESANNSRNINSNYSTMLFSNSDAEATFYYYTDILVKDKDNNMVSNATIVFTNPQKLDFLSVDGYGKNKEKFQTTIKGRTYLPEEDRKSCPSLAEMYKNSTVTYNNLYHTASIIAPNGDKLSLSGITPDSSWYRKDPNIPTYTITAIIPNTSSTGPQIIGFAPAENNPFNPGETKNFRVWTNESLTEMSWYVDGSDSPVSKGSLNYTWPITEGNHTIKFIGSNANGPVNKTWYLGGSSDEPSIPGGNPIQEIEFSPADSVLTRNVSETVDFSVSPDVFTTKEWYIDGKLIQNNTVSMSKSWGTASTYNVTFSGSGSEDVLHTWTVKVVEEPKDDEVQNKSIITIAPEYQIIEPKKSFDLSIKIEPGTPISGTQLDFVFNSSKTSVNNVTEGDLLKQSGAYTIFSKGTTDNSTGTVKNIYGFILGTSNVSSPGTMATINLTAGSKTGMAEFSLTNVLISDADSKSVPYTVTNATVLIDTAPVMSTICCPKSVDEKSTLTFKISAKDADCDRLTLSASGLPEGASFNKTSGNFTWTPAVGQAGVYTLTFEVSDGYLTDSENVTVTVNKLNNSPVINSFEPLNGSSFSEGERIEISVNASDAEGQALNYSIRIDGAVCSTGTEYVWETNYSSSGNHTIEVVVSDGTDEVKELHTIYISECRPRWDVNEDGVVNILDVTSVSQKCGTTVSKPYPRYDVNQDGAVNILDLTLVGNHFGELVK